MIICSQCGNSLADGLRYCTECGATVPASAAPAAPQPAPAYVSPRPVVPPTQAAPAAQPKARVNPLPWIIASIAVLGAVAVIVYYNSKSGAGSSYGAPRNSNMSNAPYDGGSVSGGTPARNANVYPTPGGANTSSSNRVGTSNSNSGTATADGRRLAYCNANTLNIRSTPVLDPGKSNYVGELTRGDQVWILRESSNYDTSSTGVTSNWAEIQTVNGSMRGWVFRYYLELVDGED
jgi:hypothetical protein